MTPSRQGGGNADVGEQLAEYHRKRDFARTPEPAGRVPEPRPGERRFVVQRHRARRLHYDLRFEIGGVLVSWAVPKGPTLDPNVRRMAVHVEDHPIEYLDFEGVIPSGEYGGGDVIVWDIGTWEPHATDDPAAAVASGDFHADMYGSKLRGRIILVRSGDPGDREQWLLLHKHDDDAIDGWEPEDHPRSVLSGRTNDEVKRNPDRLWRSELPPQRASVPVRTPTPTADELAALNHLGSGGTWSVFGRSLKLTNLDKVLFPGRADEPAVSKRELIAYAARIAPTVLPYLAGRPLNLHRFPNGAAESGFWHKQLPSHAPDWLPRWDNPHAGRGEATTYLVADEAAALVWAANFGGLEWHAWTSRAEQPDRPTYALVDIDPGEGTVWSDVVALARLHRTAFEHLDVAAYPKLTGRRGIQIWIPIEPGPSFRETRAWVEKLSKTIGRFQPDLVSWKWGVDERGGKARLDYTQNARNKTLVAPYSPRSAPGAPVSAPIAWDDLEDPNLRSDSFSLRTILDRIEERGDPFRPLLQARQGLAEFR